MSKIIKKIAPIASIALPILAPGIGSAIGAGLGIGSIGGNALLGAGLGAAGGGGVKGAALGGISGGLAGGGADYISGQAGLGAAGTSGLSRALTGAAAGGALGGTEGAVLGALGGGLSGYASGGGFADTALGTFAGSPVSETVAGPTQGSGLLGSLTNNVGGNPLKLGSLLSGAADVGSYVMGQNDLEDLEKIYGQQIGLAQEQLNPYAQAGQTAVANLQAPSLEALQSDPGYQFRLQQGNQALERSLAARGLGNSGAALKAAQEYGQGLADQTYNDYFNRQSSIANRGIGAASGLGQLFTGYGDARVGLGVEEINQRNQALSGLGRLFS